MGIDKNILRKKVYTSSVWKIFVTFKYPEGVEGVFLTKKVIELLSSKLVMMFPKIIIFWSLETKRVSHIHMLIDHFVENDLLTEMWGSCLRLVLGTETLNNNTYSEKINNSRSVLPLILYITKERNENDVVNVNFGFYGLPQ